MVTGDDNLITVDQMGSGNGLLVDVVGGTLGAGNTIDVMQDGTDNAATVSIAGDNNTSTITQN